MKAEDYEKFKPLVLMAPTDIAPELRMMQGHSFRDHYQDLRNWLFTYVQSEEDRAQFNKDLKEVADLIDLRYHEVSGHEDYVIWDYLKWYMHIEDVYADNGRECIERIVVFTAQLDIARDKESRPALTSWIIRVADQEALNIEDFNNGIVYSFGYRIKRGPTSMKSDWQRIYPGMLDFSNYQGATKLHDFYNEQRRITPKWAALVCEAFSTTYKKERQVAEQESNGVRYYTRQELDEVLKATVEAEEYRHVTKFIDDSLTSWSKYTALNTHKKQTPDTPRFSIHEGPGIVTILLERSDLDFGERAPKLQMIFSDTPNGLAITPRTSGGMTTSRMLDTFDQIVLELNQDKIVSFSSVDQIATFVDHVSDHVESNAFREAIGDPKQALKDAGDQDPSVYFSMFRRGAKKIHVNTLARSKNEGEESSLLGEIILDDIGEAGRLQLRISEESPTQPSLAKRVSDAYPNLIEGGTMIETIGDRNASKGVESELTPVWNEVRNTKADPDWVLEKRPPAEAPRPAAEELVKPLALREFSVAGCDDTMLNVFITRLLDDGGLNEHDRAALEATKRFIFDGGLSNLRDYSYVAATVAHRTQDEDQLLRRDNNAYIVIYDETGEERSDADSVVLSFQCHAANLIA